MLDLAPAPGCCTLCVYLDVLIRMVFIPLYLIFVGDTDQFQEMAHT